MKIAQILVLCLIAAAMAEEVKKNFYLEAYYKKFPRADLIKILYKIEEIRNEGRPVIGGVHDIVHLLDTDKLAERVAKEIDSNPEFQEGNIETLAEVNFADTFLGIEAPLRNFKREKLERIAYGVEKYIRIRRGQEEMTGGLLDVVPYIKNDEDLVQLIVKLVRNDKELQNSVLLELLGQHEIASIEEFEGSLKKLDKKTLVNFLIACEIYDRKTTGSRRKGGYHDYAWSLSKFDLIKAIEGFAAQHIILRGKGFVRRIIQENKVNLQPFFHGNLIVDLLEDEEIFFIFYSHRAEMETNGFLQNIEFLEQSPSLQRTIIKQFLKDNEDHEKIRKNAKLYVGGLSTYLETTGDQVLSNYCCASEIYYRQTNDIQLFGGVHDYIKVLTKGQKIEFIMKIAKDQNELFMEGELDNITKEVGGCH